MKPNTVKVSVSTTLITVVFFAGIVIFGSCANRNYQQIRVLIFSKTLGFRHESIAAGQRMFLDLGTRYGFRVDTTENANVFTEELLNGYSALVFLNTTGNILDESQQLALRRYIQSGGGFMAIHGADGAEYDWPWYGRLVGAWFESHPPGVQEAEIYVVDREHPAMTELPVVWRHTEEWHNFTSISSNMHVLAKVDEQSYSGGEHHDNHPVIWCQEFDGGRSFYTALGHSPETYSNILFVKHILGGLAFVMGEDNLFANVEIPTP